MFWARKHTGKHFHSTKVAHIWYFDVFGVSSFTSDVHAAMMQVLCLCPACALLQMRLTNHALVVKSHPTSYVWTCAIVQPMLLIPGPPAW